MNYVKLCESVDNVYILCYNRSIKRGGHTMTIQELNDLLNKGGATFKNGEIVTYESGYQVAILYDAVIRKDSEQTRAQLLYEINNGDLLDGGIWLNPKTKHIELDLLTVHISDKRDAKILGKHFKQTAILEWSTFDNIYLEDE